MLFILLHTLPLTLSFSLFLTDHPNVMHGIMGWACMSRVCLKHTGTRRNEHHHNIIHYGARGGSIPCGEVFFPLARSPRNSYRLTVCCTGSRYMERVSLPSTLQHTSNKNWVFPMHFIQADAPPPPPPPKSTTESCLISPSRSLVHDQAACLHDQPGPAP